jgi:pimeloyl-ACP methyl ester carboxylesterase
MADYRDVFYSAQDGLRLYARDYSPAQDLGLTPILCLPGLTRSSTDFADLADRLSQTRRVICADLRGRGLSAWAPAPSSYTPITELGDVLALLASVGVHRAVFIGTSRGGLISILATVMRPTAVAGIVLNDIGPEIAIAGLRRIADYAGAQPPVSGWDGAAEQSRLTNQNQFPSFGDADWQAMARRNYVERDGRVVLAYDPQIGTGFRAALDAQGSNPPADLWVPFQGLAAIPTAVIRGELSDILTDETLAKMVAAKPDLITTIVPHRGHAPLLDEPESLSAIDALLARVDGRAA